MADHIDVPGFGTFGGGPTFGGGGDLVLDAIRDADERDQSFAEAQGGNAPLSSVVGGSAQPSPTRQVSFGPSPVATSALPPVGPVVGGGPGLPFPGIPGGRPPGRLEPGSPSRAALSLLGAVAVGGAAGFYTKDLRAGGAGFLATGAVLNLLRARSEPATDRTTTGISALIGLGIAAYLGYGIYKDTHK